MNPVHSISHTYSISSDKPGGGFIIQFFWKITSPTGSQLENEAVAHKLRTKISAI